jgi:hypothetical protein
MLATASYRRVGSHSAALFATLFAISVCNVTAQAGEKVLQDPNKIQQLCHAFHQVTPPPPPVDAVLIGTFDYATGTFTWGPKVFARETEGGNPLIKDIGPVFETRHIRAITPNLDPKITSLGTAWGSSPNVNQLINSALLMNVGGGAAGAAGAPGVIGSGATSAGAGTPPPAPAAPATPRAKRGLNVKTPAVAPPAKTSPPAAGGAAGAGGTLTDVTATINQKAPLTGHALLGRRFYVPVRAGCVDMVFKVLNRPADAQVSISAEGRTSTASADQVDLVVPLRVGTKFSLKVGAKNFDDTIIFDRPPVIGCFTLEALPITIVYEPPGSSSSQKYSSSKTIGTTISSFTSKESSGSEPVDTPFSTVNDVIDMVATVGKVVAIVYPQVGEGMQAASEVAGGIWGSSKTDEKITNTVTDTHTLSIQMTDTSWQATGTHQGPGKGDAFHFLRKPTFLWLAAQDEAKNSVYITLALVGYEGAGSASAEDLRQGNVPLVPKDMQKLMLALDPLAPEYAGGFSKGPLSAQAQSLGSALSGTLGKAAGLGRLAPADPFTYVFVGTQSGMGYTRKIEESDVHAKTTSHSITTTETAGFLSYVAKNVPQDGTNTVSMTQGSSAGTSVGTTVQDDVTFGAQQGEAYAVEIFFDNLFGTFAFKDIPDSEAQQATGQAMTSGQPVSSKPIEILTPDGLRIVTTTDKSGNFKAPLLQKGTYKIKLEGKEIPFEFKGKPVTMKVDTATGTAELGATAQAASSGTKTKVTKSSLDGVGGAASQPTVNETANTAGAIRGKPAPPPPSQPPPPPAKKKKPK